MHSELLTAIIGSITSVIVAIIPLWFERRRAGEHGQHFGRIMPVVAFLTGLFSIALVLVWLAQTPPSFNARTDRMSVRVPGHDGQPVTYNKVTSTRNAFTSNAFIAPRDGLYLFSISFRRDGAGDDLLLALLKNADEVATAQTPDSQQRAFAALTTTLSLNKGDRISTAFRCDKGRYGQQFSVSAVSFDGALIAEYRLGSSSIDKH